MTKSSSGFRKNLKKAILDTLFPIFCFGCGREGSWLCNECVKKVKILERQYCPQCEKEITLSGSLCGKCRHGKKSHLDALISSTGYDAPAIKKLTHGLKYRYLTDAAGVLSHFIIKALLFHDCPLPFAIVPVPLHKKRLRWRGFNQAQLLAEKISENLAPPLVISVLDILERKKYNKPQMEIKNYQERLRNVEDIFQLKSDFDCSPIQKKTLLLVDDIATTGATLQECAKILKESGAKKVIAAVVARQSLKEKGI